MPRERRRPKGVLASRIDHLFQGSVSASGRPYSNREAARLINEAAGRELISHGYLSQLRAGDRDNPTKEHIAALAALFEVSPAYFFDDPASAGAQAHAEALAAMRDEDIRATALGLVGLPPAGRAAVTQLIASLHALADPPGGDQDRSPRAETRPG